MRARPANPFISMRLARRTPARRAAGFVMHAGQLSFVPLFIVIALSFAVPVVLSPLRRFGIPVIVGEILAGIAVGQSGLGWVEAGPVLDVLSVFGFAYLMFLSGLEMDFSQIPSEPRGLRSVGGLQRLARNPFVLGGLTFAATALASIAAGFYIWRLGLIDNPLLMALILSTTSLGVVAPVLKERGLLDSRYGQTLLVCALIADFVTVLLISSTVLVRRNGLTLEPLLVLFLVLAFVVAYPFAARFSRHGPARRLLELLSTATSQIQVRGSLAIALVFIGLAETLGIEDILGAFLAGVIVSLLAGRRTSMLNEKLEAIGYGFFIPVFFVMVGVQFDLPALVASGSALQLVALLVVIAFGVKLVGGLMFRLVYGWRETFAASSLLSARLSLIIAVATIGVEIGAIGPAFQAAIILTAIITCLVSPVLFSAVLPRAEADAPLTLIVGDGADAETLAARLTRLGHRVELVTRLPHAEQGDDGAALTTAPAAMIARLHAADIDHAHAVVAMTERDADTLQVCRVAHSIHAVRNLVAWVDDSTLNPRFAELGARVINPGNFRVLLLESLLVSGEAQIDAAEVSDDRRTRVVKLRNWWLREQPLGNIARPDSVHVLSIERGSGVIFPGPDTLVSGDDIVTLSGKPDEVESFARRLAKRF